MKDGRRTGHWLGTALVALLLAGPGAAGAAECNSCCQLPCVEAAINTAEGMRKLFARLKTRKKLTQDAYVKEVDAERARFGRESFDAIGNLPQCASHLPDPKDTMQFRRVINAGWGVKSVTDESGRTQLAYDISVQTNMETCSLNDNQLSLFKEISACTQLGVATEMHERKHLEQCKGRKKGTKDSTTVQATQEEEAYGVQVDYLKQLRKTLEAACREKSCKQDATDKDAQGLHNGLNLMRAIQARSGR